MTLIGRAGLTIVDPVSAANLTAVDVWADGEEGLIKVRLSIIYNDLSNQEWWRDKKEKVLGTYLILQGQTIRPAELLNFGIEPFEMRAVALERVEPAGLLQGNLPHITNNTTGLVVVSVERGNEFFRPSRPSYKVLVKNISTKNIVGYSVHTGVGQGRASYAGRGPLIAAGATHWIEHLQSADAENQGVTIAALVFEDGTFEGDELFAIRFLARLEGERIQAPHVLLMIQQALDATDADLETEFEKLESDLWKIPEAIDKAPAIELLRARFSHLDRRTIDNLYEELKGGLYEARNHALSPLGNTKRELNENRAYAGADKKQDRIKNIRAALTRIKNDFERMIARQ
jgi:hypothetical protein